MIIVLKPGSGRGEIERLKNRIREKGLKPFESKGTNRTVINVVGDVRDSARFWKAHACVEEVAKISRPYKLASRNHSVKSDVVRIGEAVFGGGGFGVIAGPCSLESREQVFEAAGYLKRAGVGILRASTFKPRTSPYDFQGLGRKGLKILREVREATGMMVETEVMDVRDAAVAAEYVDVLRVGARNMQNFDLLREIGRLDTPVILKRGMSATVKEFIMAAEYVLLSGNSNVILCERGIRTFETAYRNVLDLSAVALLKRETNLPVIVDPSHAAGRTDLVTPLARAAVAVGADGLIVETHPDPEQALSDGAQSLSPGEFMKFMEEVKLMCNAMKKNIFPEKGAKDELVEIQKQD